MKTPFARPVVAPLPPLPPLSRLALFLDLDGTLLDIAASPTAVRVPAGLPDALSRLRERLNGALAVISGRTVAEVEALLPGLGLAIAGEHGAAIRRGDRLPLERPSLPDVPPEWEKAARGLAAAHPGVLFERKPHGFVLHYRQAPAVGPFLFDSLTALVAASDRFELSRAAMAWEVRPRGVDKAMAVRALLDQAPFAGRLPVFIGDDVTDEDGIRAAREAGGFGFKVDQTFGDSDGVRAWIACLAGADGTAEERP